MTHVYCARCVLCWLAFPSAPALGSTGSVAGFPALFVSFLAIASYYGGIRLLTIADHRLRLLAFPMRATAAQILSLLADRETSRFPSRERRKVFDHAGPGEHSRWRARPLPSGFQTSVNVRRDPDRSFAAHPIWRHQLISL